jgi:hypothetical protein
MDLTSHDMCRVVIEYGHFQIPLCGLVESDCRLRISKDFSIPKSFVDLKQVRRWSTVPDKFNHRTLLHTCPSQGRPGVNGHLSDGSSPLKSELPDAGAHRRAERYL